MVLYFGDNKNALLAQLDRAFGYGPKGQEFESLTARQKTSRKACLFCFWKIKKEIRTGQIRSIKNSPVDCFVVRVRADERRSEAGESLTARKTKSKGLSFFVKKPHFRELFLGANRFFR